MQLARNDLCYLKSWATSLVLPFSSHVVESVVTAASFYSLHCLSRWQSRERIGTTRGQWKAIDPSYWIRIAFHCNAETIALRHRTRTFWMNDYRCFTLSKEFGGSDFTFLTSNPGYATLQNSRCRRWTSVVLAYVTADIIQGSDVIRTVMGTRCK